eukprot:303980-Chlamydomonas_euryale.AAC.4
MAASGVAAGSGQQMCKASLFTCGIPCGATCPPCCMCLSVLLQDAQWWHVSKSPRGVGGAWHGLSWCPNRCHACLHLQGRACRTEGRVTIA